MDQNIKIKEDNNEINKENNEIDEIINIINNKVEINEDNIEKEKNYIIGIDLGTSNSCVSIWRNNNLEIIPDIESGENTIPSYVSYTKINRYVGKSAKNQKELNPKNVFYEFKRLIGRKINDKNIINEKEFLNYDIVSGDSNEDDNIYVETDFGKKISPEELSSIILKRLKDSACKYLNCNVKDAVITVPAYFNDAQRQATKDAAEIAGLNCKRIINEPTSAALTYGLLNKSLSKLDENKSFNIIVYDFGGGTTDVSLLNISNGLFEVKASVGNTQLGGIDFDNKIIKYCLTTFKRQYNYEKLDNIQTLSYQKLKRSCENAKKILSTEMKTNIIVKNFYDDKDLIILLTRERLNIICNDLLILGNYLLDEILISSELNKENIDEIILVGGMTRMPAIIDNVKKFFNGKEPNCSINPDEVVSAGAAIQGYILNNKDDPFSDNIRLLDIIPLSMGIETFGGVMNTIIPKNTIIPTSKKRLYTTNSDNETSVIIKIFEGERKITKDNFLVGSFELDDIDPAPRGIPVIEVKFNIDINGIITVTAEDITFKNKNGNKKSLTITGNKGRLKLEQIQQLIKEAKEYEINDKLMAKKRELYYTIDGILSNIKLNLLNKDNKLNEKDKKIILNDVEINYNWLVEKNLNYNNITIDEYDEKIKSLEKKFGTLILKISNNNKNVSEITKKINATTIYGNDDDDNKLNDINNKIKKTNENGDDYNDIDIDIDNDENNDDDILNEFNTESEEEKKELIFIKNNLIELCQSIYDLFKEENNISKVINKEDKNKIIEEIDDTLLWCHTIDKPKKIDFLNKINFINNNSNNLFEKYKDEISKYYNTTKNNIDELEKLCLSIKSSIVCGLFSFNEKTTNQLIEELDNYLNEINEFKLLENISDENYNIFENKCKDYIETIQYKCKNIENELIIGSFNIDIDIDISSNLNKYDNNNEGTSITDILNNKS